MVITANSGLLLFIIGSLFYLLIFIISKIEVYLNRRKHKLEIDSWLKNSEHKYRELKDYPEDWGMRRKAMALRFNYTCQICDRRGWLGFHIHHAIPLSKGGNNSLDNLIYLCKWCHERQHPHMLVERYNRFKKIKETRKKAYWKSYWVRENHY